MSIIHMLRRHLSLRPWTPWVIILHDKRKKLLIFTVFTWFLILDKIKDGDHVWWRQRPPAVLLPIKYTSSCGEDQRPTTKGSTTYRNLKGGGGRFHQPPTPLRVRPRVNKKNERDSVKPIFLFELVPKFHWIVQSSPLWWHSSATAIRSKGTYY